MINISYLLIMNIIFYCNSLFIAIDNKTTLSSLHDLSQVIAMVEQKQITERPVLDGPNKVMEAALNPWIPLFSAFTGAIIGFISSFLVAFYLQNRLDLRVHNDLIRKKLEELYIATIDISSEYNRLFLQCTLHINKADFKSEVNPQFIINSEGIPPLVKCEMLLNLYLPSHKAKFNDFLKLKEEFDMVKQKFTPQLSNFH